MIRRSYGKGVRRMIIHIDLTSAIIGVMIIPTIVFLCGIAMVLTKRISTFTVGSYVKETVRRNNDLIEENQRLRKELEE